MGCAACGKKYPPASVSPEQRQAARHAIAERRAQLVEQLKAQGNAFMAQAASMPRVPIGRSRTPGLSPNRGYVPAVEKPIAPPAPGGGPGFPEHLLVKGVK